MDKNVGLKQADAQSSEWDTIRKIREGDLMPEPLRCKDKRFNPKTDHSTWYIHWCPYAEQTLMGDPDVAYEDYRCLNWLKRCKKTGKIVVHNKKCDVLEVKQKFEVVIPISEERP